MMDTAENINVWHSLAWMPSYSLLYPSITSAQFRHIAYWKHYCSFRPSGMILSRSCDCHRPVMEHRPQWTGVKIPNWTYNWQRHCRLTVRLQLHGTLQSMANDIIAVRKKNAKYCYFMRFLQTPTISQPSTRAPTTLYRLSLCTVNFVLNPHVVNVNVNKKSPTIL